jgi:hypothetical protein
MFDIADRLAIMQLVSLYSYFIDEGRYDEWLGAFTEDVVFQTPSRAFNVRDEIPAVIGWNQRLHARGGHSRHLLPNITFLDQTAECATVVIYGLFVASEQDGTSVANSPVRYEGELVKQEDGWRIRRWSLQLDRPLG